MQAVAHLGGLVGVKRRAEQGVVQLQLVCPQATRLLEHSERPLIYRTAMQRKACQQLAWARQTLVGVRLALGALPQHLDLEQKASSSVLQCLLYQPAYNLCQRA